MLKGCAEKAFCPVGIPCRMHMGIGSQQILSANPISYAINTTPAVDFEDKFQVLLFGKHRFGVVEFMASQELTHGIEGVWACNF